MIDQIEKAIAVLKNHGTIIYPTDTIWGIGCDATDPEAVEKIRTIKGRPGTKSMIILLGDENQLDKYITQVPEIAWDLIGQVDTPLTIIFEGARNLAKNLIAPDGSIAIRVVKHPFCQQLIRKLGHPLVSTSANFSGEPFPISFQKISSKLLEQVDYVVDYERDKINSTQPSEIIKLGIKGEIELIRR